MANASNTLQWEASTFSFDTPYQAEECKTLYIGTINYLKALDINVDKVDQSKKGWRKKDDVPR